MPSIQVNNNKKMKKKTGARNNTADYRNFVK